MTDAELAALAAKASFWGRVEQLAFLGVVLTLAVEFVALKVGEPYKEAIDHERSIRLANAEKAAADAKLALEKFKAPRTISEEQGASIASKLKSFAPQEYAITTFWDLKEPLAFAERIHEVLQASGWKFLPPPQGGAFLLGGIAGVQVWTHPEADKPTKDAAGALIEALRAEQIEAEPRTQNPANPKENGIRLNVGTKP